MSQRHLIQQLPGIIAHNRHARIGPIPLSLSQSMTHLSPKINLYRALVVFCLICIQIITYTCSTIPAALANTTIMSSHLSSNSFLYPNAKNKGKPYDASAFSVSENPVTFGEIDPPTHQLTLTNGDDPTGDRPGPIPWYVEKIIRDTGKSTDPICGQTHWLHVDPQRGEVELKGGSVSVSVKKGDLPPGTMCEGEIDFLAPKYSENDLDQRVPITIDFTVPQKDPDSH